jgi:hypothetical protein
VAALVKSAYQVNSVMVWDTQRGRRWRTFEGGHSVGAMTFRGETLALAIGEHQIDLYEPDQGEDPAANYSIPGIARAMRFRDDGATLAVTTFGAGFTELETSTGRVLRQAGAPENRAVGECRPNADWSVIAGSTDGGILLWGSGWNHKEKGTS